ncbi:methylthioribulose 1-phosphate dehydratase [Paenibacillus sp. CGMCC 1.16610]|uniref:Methylthioribulose-1-phosphate dehydratase n=2 Tax=Paenibacillus TaxID=44249 RepID=A0ABU6DHS4_9BACL|nr:MULTISPECIES: methylthioribulose 1-phosphate dehydratase [Paenibacillus]MBA2942333.1 methylthioribulose 1-phosphate dehydratase [Paenibacillus sp. CGMCC 1.16610]MCY9657243.1 methylthioribulose 1-phosphate dehydratase [Paenibacillus anseongense]MEB4797306.1 methylthioribulose 1-phosphate dehydratase [Paenibacillus chondroitinus]MVQ36164.1 methylthioribulose 1-phosphate dehydratase [Paenibacillus anseongense]
MSILLEEKQRAFAELREIKANLAARGWFPATSGNLSVRVGGFEPEQFTFAITSSGKDKSVQTPEDFLLVNEKGVATEATSLKPSAETLIHSEIYRLTGAGAIFHVHTIFNNLVSELYWERKSIPVDGVELIKAFNIWDEEAQIEIPILPNYAEIPRIAALVEDAIVPRIPGIVLRKHGIYAWGANAFEAKRHLEAFEFLFEYVYRSHLLNK